MAVPTLFWMGESGDSKADNVEPRHDVLITFENGTSINFGAVEQVHEGRQDDSLRYKRQQEKMSKTSKSPAGDLIDPMVALLQDWDIKATIRSLICPQCLLRGLGFTMIFVSSEVICGHTLGCDVKPLQVHNTLQFFLNVIFLLILFYSFFTKLYLSSAYPTRCKLT